MTAEEAIQRMQMRDYFAAHALNGILSHHECDYIPFNSGTPKKVAADCYIIADAMLEERVKPSPRSDKEGSK